MGGTIIELELTWCDRAILIMLYLNKGKISKQKLSALLYLIYKEFKNIDPLEDLDFYINMKTKEIEVYTPNSKSVDINDILDNISYFWEAIKYNPKENIIYLTDKGYRIAKELMNDPKFKDEIKATVKTIFLYKDMSEKDLMNLILESLKHS